MTIPCFGRLGAACCISLTLLAGMAAAAPFTPGNVVVYRVGTGTGSLVATGNAVFLDEYSPAGTLVQAIALPTAANGAQKALVASGTATTDGLLTRSADGACLIVPGYARDLGTGSGNLATTGTVAGGGAIPRVVARVTPQGVVDTTTALTDASLQSNFRGAASSDCASAWVSGTAATTGGGVRYTTIGSTTSVDLTAASFANTRAVVVHGGQLFVSASVTALRAVASVGSGVPATGPQAVAKLPGLPDPAANGQPYAFFFTRLNAASPGADTLYVADESFGVAKYSLVAGIWVANGTVGAGVDAYRGVTGTTSGTTVTLFATRKGGSTSTGGGELVSIVDTSGHNGAFVGVPVLRAVAGANTAFRGVAMAPQSPPPPTFTVTPSAGANGSIDAATPQVVFSGATVQFTVTPDAGFTASVGGTCGGTLIGTLYTTSAVTTNCTVVASFAPLPRYVVTPSVGPNGAIEPSAPLEVISGQSASFAVVPAPGYNAAVRGTCGGGFMGDIYVTRPVASDCTIAVVFARKLVLFVGNSYTFGRVDPVMSYNAAAVTDLTNDMWLANPTGSNDDEPHPWGGIPGVFKKMTDQAGLDYDVSISARNAASLRGHFLNSNPAGWDLRGNIASQRWNAVVLQDLSDEPLPAGRGANANLPYFNAYVDKIESWVHAGASETYTESQLFGGTTASCQAITGASASACNTPREIAPANGNARPGAEVYLYQTWARPDMIGPNGTNADGLFYSAAEGLEAMTADFHNAYFGRMAANPGIEDVSAVGDAFLRAVVDGVAMRDPYVPEAGKVNLWHTDYFHPSKYGSYLSAAVHFATITGLNPLTLGPGEQAAAALGIEPDIAMKLQRAAQAVFLPDTIAPVSTVTVSEPPNAAGWNRGDVTVSLSATDNPGGSLVDAIQYTLSGAQTGSGSFGTSGSLTISSGGVTTLTYYAVDRAGNSEAARTLRVAIDAIAPVTTVTVSDPPNALGWNRTPVTVGLAATDNPGGSLVDSIQYTLSGAQTGTGSFGASGSLTISSEGVTTLTYFAIDRAGNVESVRTLRVAIDKTAPVTTLTVSEPPNALGWNRGDVTVSLAATDNAGGSLVDAIRYTLSGAQTGTGSFGTGGSLTISSEGVTTLTYFAVDRAGNAETARTLRVAIDRTPPAITGMPAASCSLWPPNNKMVEVATVLAAGGASGLAAFSVTAVSNEPPTKPNEPDVMISGSGFDPRKVSLRASRLGSGAGRVYTVTATASDLAGNSTTVSTTCVVPHNQ